MAVDLHTHSSYSDGSESPTSLVNRAIEAGLSAVALTDHDTLEGIDEARTAAGAAIALIPGIELSVSWRGRPMHLLAYFVEPGNGPLQDRLADIRDSRHHRNHEMVEGLQSLGIDITIDEVEHRSDRGVTGRPHIAGVLLDKGYVASIAEAFDRFLAQGRPAYRPRLRLEAAEAAALTRASSGATSVAHPHTVADNSDDFGTLFRDLVDLGIDGVECHYAEYSIDERIALSDKAKRLGLVATGGSDFHGTYKPGIDVGVGRGDLMVPDSALDEIDARRNRL